MLTHSESYKNLETVLSDSTVFMDTCSLMNYKAPAFFQTIAPILHSTCKKIIILNSVRKELVTFSADFTKQQRQSQALMALQLLNKLIANDAVSFTGSSTTYPDADFLEKAIKNRSECKQLYITQDFQLARDLINLNFVRSTRGHEIFAKRISLHAVLNDFDFSNPPKVKKPAQDIQRMSEAANVSTVLRRYDIKY